MTMAVITAVAEFERDLLIERTQAGLARAKAEGKTLGRPQTMSDAEKVKAKTRLQYGESVSAVAKDLGVSRQTVMRARESGVLSGIGGPC
jgi:putative DNA-invertase from lambdoid prophage Rac